MAFHNANWAALPMGVGTYSLEDLGDGLNKSFIHEIFCTNSGSITITAMGGGTFTWSATSGQSVKVVASNVIVNSGSFVGFKSQHQKNFIQQLNS